MPVYTVYYTVVQKAEAIEKLNKNDKEIKMHFLAQKNQVDSFDSFDGFISNQKPVFKRESLLVSSFCHLGKQKCLWKVIQ